ncbi:MAG: hypothetical protein K0U40_05435, partial [Betaproteobacteria bacterium]|nr:hypothetical protein [Betaproteobacteria bacterium]
MNILIKKLSEKIWSNYLLKRRNIFISIVIYLFILNPTVLFAGELHQHIEVTIVDQRVQANFCRP